MEPQLQVMERVLQAPENEEIAELYSQIRTDPDFLQTFDQKQFVDTPLHLATAEGRTLLALEIQRLMPSFGQKLNANGFSPVELALQRGHTETVSAMIKLNPELVRVQGREGITPLHYAAEVDDVEILAEFLLICPDSIEDLTVRGESAVHVAVKNGHLAAFMVLLGWLERTDRRQVLEWRDWKGNTVLHIAASTNQPEVMELLVKNAWGIVIVKNSNGLTALDIVMELPTDVNERAVQILRRERAKRGPSIRHPKIATFADYLSTNITIMESIFKSVTYLDLALPGDVRNAVLVVAVLVVTATYQAALSPPGGFSDPSPFIGNITSVPHNLSNTTTSTNITSNIGVVVMKDDGNKESIRQKDYFLAFALLNSIALAASLATIGLLLPYTIFTALIHFSLFCLLFGYIQALGFKSETANNETACIIFPCYCVFCLIMMLKGMVFPWAIARASRRHMGSDSFYNFHEVMTLVYWTTYLRRN